VALLAVNYSPPVAGSVTKTVYLDQGANLIPILVTAPDGLTQHSYVLSVNGTVSNADLDSLAVFPGSLVFDPAVTAYLLEVDSSVSQLTLTAVPQDSKALVLVNGSILSGGSTTVSLSPGLNTIDVMVVAQNASTKTYTITVDVAAPSIDTDILVPATAGKPYTAQLAASGGTPPYTWSAAGFPAGLSMDSSTGVISGVPEATGTS